MLNIYTKRIVITISLGQASARGPWGSVFILPPNIFIDGLDEDSGNLLIKTVDGSKLRGRSQKIESIVKKTG